MQFTTTLLSLASLWSLAASSPVQVATNSTQMSATSTTSSSTACPTMPEEGTYCGFINPEDPCAPQPGGYGPKMHPDTVSAFQHYTPFQSMSLNSTSARGYTTIFKNLTAAAKTNKYIGLYLLESYNITACAAKCDEISGCNSFNVYVERDPSLNPTKNDSSLPSVWGYWCPQPASMTNFKCALWSDGIYNSSATNNGQHRGDFEVVIAGSNAYVKNGFFNSTTYRTGPGGVKPTPSSVAGQYTGAGAALEWSVWGVVCAFGLTVFMGL